MNMNKLIEVTVKISSELYKQWICKCTLKLLYKDREPLFEASEDGEINKKDTI